jgi:hypothetical protein
MSADDFFQLWPQFKQIKYQDTFIADRVLVFERNAISDTKGYALIDVIHFKNKRDDDNSLNPKPHMHTMCGL